MTKDLYCAIENYMQNTMADSAHDKEHVYRVLHNALAIAKAEDSVDHDILITACLLHDIGRPEQFADPTLCHAVVGAQKAQKFLEGLGLDASFIQAVCHCIRTHRFSNRMPPETLEAKILFDADKLDVTGALGIARTLQFQGKHDYPLYTRLPDGSISTDPLGKEKSFFQEYHRKLTKLYDGFLTSEGKRLAQSQQEDAKRFYDALWAQVAKEDSDLSLWVKS